MNRNADPEFAIHLSAYLRAPSRDHMACSVQVEEDVCGNQVGMFCCHFHGVRVFFFIHFVFCLAKKQTVPLTTVVLTSSLL